MDLEYRFEEPLAAVPMLRYGGELLYMNEAAAKEYRGKGGYVVVKVDPDRKAVLLFSSRKPGRSIYRLRAANGSPLRVRDRLLKSGLPHGLYIFLGQGVFQHVDYLPEDDE